MLRAIAGGALAAFAVTAVAHAQVPGHKQEARHGAASAGAKGGGTKTEAEHAHAPVPSISCSPQSVGPQSPRDINQNGGENRTAFTVAKSSNTMQLCNAHFHKNAEHRGIGFTKVASPTGHQCDAALSPVFKTPVAGAPNGVCEGTVKPGDTIEMHFVFTSCKDASPGPTLGACSTKSCRNPSLRVEARIFVLVNSHGNQHVPGLGSLAKVSEFGSLFGSHEHLPPVVVPSAARAVQYQGSTTNTAFDNSSTCSPAHVTWQVGQSCTPLDIRSLQEWCEGNNPFREKEGNVMKPIEGHGARALVTNPKLLSAIK